MGSRYILALQSAWFADVLTLGRSKAYKEINISEKKHQGFRARNQRFHTFLDRKTMWMNVDAINWNGKKLCMEATLVEKQFNFQHIVWYWCEILACWLLFKYILIIPLQMSQFFLPFISLCPALPSLQHLPSLSSCPWVMHISSLASPFPILFLTSPCLFCIYQLCFLFPVTFPPFSPSPLITLHVISISVILFLL